jgi:maleate isomerase
MAQVGENIGGSAGIAELSAHYDAGIGPLGRIGFVALANGYTAEHEVNRMLPEGFVLYITRVWSDNSVTLGNLRKIEGDLTRAAGMILPQDDLDVMVYSCTSGTVAIGEEAVERCIHEARPGVPVTNPITAALAAFEALGVKRIALLTPYVFEVTFNIELNSDIQRVSTASIRDAATSLDLDGADALFISCTALRTAEVIEGIEQAIGKPVVTSNQALAWHALQLAGHDRVEPGLGRLFRL